MVTKKTKKSYNVGLFEIKSTRCTHQYIMCIQNCLKCTHNVYTELIDTG